MFTLNDEELLELYKSIAGISVINELEQMATVLKDIKILHINSTKEGGGVAEILASMTRLTTALGIKNDWEILTGNADFFECTKAFHNGLQGHRISMPEERLLKNYEEINAQNAERLKPLIEKADVVIVHDPQPAALIQHFPNRTNKWIWRCHIDLSNPHRYIWKYLRKFVSLYDASIFSLSDFAQSLPNPIFLIPPSIDPLTEKNIDLTQDQIDQVYSEFHIDSKRPMILQVSRFDRFKDPIGVIEAYRLAKKFSSGLQLVMAGGGAHDDPEGEMVLNEVKKAAGIDPDIHILFLPSNAHLTINALQRAATIVLQKSIKEGFGLTVTEALWKNKPVIGGNTGGIRLQVINHLTGFLVNTPEGAALSISLLLKNPELVKTLGDQGKMLVKENFLITRQVRDYFAVLISLLNPFNDKIELTNLRLK